MTEDLLHATVSVRGVILNSRGKVLTLQRTSDHEWELPGGRLGRGEPTLEGLQREIHEETALSAEVDRIVAANSWVNGEEQGRFAVHYRCYTSERIVELSEEHTDSAWVLPKETAHILREPQTAAVHAATTPTEPNSEVIDRSSLAHD
ncbi:NUDIX domain-containing protein [Halorubrum lacusprofundi]|jgi:8-oxo-dGTP pyrophosphatase MutT (NUDIX family)|uniref:NUDIX domain-containing protein n=1 Tax=Halorubrum lacusprofundi TaxID=2247 RepID=UPI000B5A82AB|nr:NUDIX domain-containing protein [Halorubrum lacusprofundi]MCG1007639.1 NUDIX domain-containing protein [Halorubrum lacusprofundi]